MIGCSIFSAGVIASEPESKRIKQAALDYIESQHQVDKKRMARALHPEMKKRTWWIDKNQSDVVMETSYDTMLKVAQTYNADGRQFPEQPSKKVEILDWDHRVASVKLTADDWIDYMHLVKVNGEWKVINVLWQYKDHKRHKSR
nr:nuclear transport factor 2 family protein [Pleionea sp. CnH1-48]